MSEWETLQREAIVIDGHADTPQRFVDEGWDMADPVGTGMVSLETARAGGLDAEFFAVWVDPHEWPGRYAERSASLLAGVQQQLAKHPDAMVLGLSADDIVKAKAAGKFCVLLGLEGGHAIEASLEKLRAFYAQGVRYMTLTWTNTNEWADSSGDMDDANVQHHGGLTDFGREVIAEMNRLGMMVDVSHVSDATFWQVLECSTAPIIASHSSARALNGAMRNLTDEQLRAVATKRGIVMVNFYASFIDEAFREAWRATEAMRKPLYEAADKPWRERGVPAPYAASLTVDRAFYAEHVGKLFPAPRFEALIDHFDHIAKVAGIEHVGVGSDFDGFAILPEGLQSAADLPKITRVLLERGYTAEQLKLLLGGNMLRVMREVAAAGR
ncbi:membrane dipeptidase [Bryocella elongata]|uniref:Membrane dipeptidase n=1 Tax=Bryocella elongata TaxID=863522 RepID=A0A1H5SG64_9BACT|nr:dipeptidase [Bryocella elongata]SEF48928.1 membrane dipeptidase [Bryocella elongata]